MLGGFGLGSLATVPAMLLAFISSGGGHGDYLWAMMLFPYSMISAVATDFAHRISDLEIVVGFAQFPLYGLLLGLPLTPKAKRNVRVFFIILHLTMVLVVWFAGGRELYHQAYPVVW